jgi:methionyl-tRNA formyltransferase
MKVVYMGTPDFAVPALKALIEKHEVVAVISQPDKPKGRGKHLAPTPVKEEALKHSIPVYQPERIKSEEAVELVRSLDADIFVVAAYGQILPVSILEKPKYGCINIHGSLLPKYRGAAPIQWALIDGEESSGVTIMYMAEGLDCGDMLLKKEIPIESEDTYGTLYDKISELGATAVLEAMELIENGTAKPEKQDDNKSTYAKKIVKEMGLIDWSKTSREINNLVRGFNPMPVAHTTYNGEVFKIWSVAPVEGDYVGECGEIVEVNPKRGFTVKTGDGAVLVREMQAKGGKRMTSADYMRGHAVEKGVKLV